MVSKTYILPQDQAAFERDQPWTLSARLVYDPPILLRLSYDLEVDGREVRFESPNPVTGSASGFAFELSNDVLTVESADRFHEIDSFRSIVEPFLLPGKSTS